MIDPQRMRPPHIAALFLVLAVLLHGIFQPSRLIPESCSVLGIGLLVFGILGMSVAHGLFSKRRTPVRHDQVPSFLVQEGPYKYTRNPMYIGGLTGFLGLAIWIGTWPFFLLVIGLFVILDRIFVPWEEQTMLKIFSQEYSAYRQRTRRWL